MQTKIRALGGVYAAVSVTFSVDHYVITSGTSGTGSKVRITNADDHNIAEELEIGTANGGTDTDGTGDVANAAAVTAAEIAAVINTDIALVTATVETNKVRITSKTTGATSSIVMGNGTLNTAVGLTNAAAYYGATGLGLAQDMADTNYSVLMTFTGLQTGALADPGLSTHTKATTGFNIECGVSSATGIVEMVIIGKI